MWKKGPETLIACTVCFKVKMSCKTGGDGAQGRKQAKTPVRKTQKDSTAEDVERRTGRRMVRPETEVWKWEWCRAVKKLDGVAGRPDRRDSWLRKGWKIFVHPDRHVLADIS